ncbi:MAG: hypothetical protein M1823_004905 [Watsoniomyces obsoletus]|nr:MAG: hypothetical protein M1823_004905 [Watsoniomyces obsoletus]
MAHLSADEFLAQITASLAAPSVGGSSDAVRLSSGSSGQQEDLLTGSGRRSGSVEPDDEENLIEVDPPASSSGTGGPVSEVPRDLHTQMAIDFTNVPADLSVRSLLGAIRVPDGRLRVVAINIPGRQARIVFAEMSAHETFMRNIYEGTWRFPGAETPHIRVIQEEVPIPRGDEASPNTTRVLMIRSPPGEQRALPTVLEDLRTTAHDWRYDIEKAIHGEDGEGNLGRFVCIYFGSIQDAVHAKKALCLHSSVAFKYGGSRFSYGYDDCSTTGPGERFSMMTIRNMRLPSTSTPGFINIPPFPAPTVQPSMPPPPSAISSQQLQRLPPPSLQPPIVPPRAPRALNTAPPSGPMRSTVPPVMTRPSSTGSQQSALVRIDQNIPTSIPASISPPDSDYRVDLSAGLYPLPPFDCHKHGIVIHQIPHLITEAALLAGIHGGNVRRVFIFRPGRHIDGTAAHGAVFFNTQAIADAILNRMMDRKGLYIPLVRRRYRATPYTTTCPAADEYYPPDHTRVVSMFIHEGTGEQRITIDSLRRYAREATRIMLGDGEVQALPKPPGMDRRRFIFTVGSIKAATLLKAALAALTVNGENATVQFERDPCSGPVERMQ